MPVIGVTIKENPTNVVSPSRQELDDHLLIICLAKRDEHLEAKKHAGDGKPSKGKCHS